MLAGTSRGVYKVTDAGAQHVLAGRGVWEITAAGDYLFAGTGAGLYRSANQGADWELSGLADRAVWQVRADRNGELYAGTQPAGLFHSADGGDNWLEVQTFSAAPEAEHWCIPVDPPQPGQARALVIDRQNPKRLWVGVEVGGIMHTDDAGNAWRLDLPGDNPDIHMMFAHPENPDILFVSTGYGRLDGVAEMVEGNAGVFRSEDAGESWEYAWHGITPRYSRPMCIDPRPPFSLTVASAPDAFSSYKRAVGAGAMLFRSDDGGRSWRSLCDSAHSPSAVNFHGLQPDPQQPGGVVVGTDNGEIWRVSADSKWQQVCADLPAVLSLLPE